MSVAAIITDLVWDNIHTKVHGLLADYKPMSETHKIINGLLKREKDNTLDLCDLSKPIYNAFQLYKKHQTFLT